MYRHERSGVLHGLLRVRGFTQDDAHIFCTPEQMEDEILRVLRFSCPVARFGFHNIHAYLATRPKGGGRAGALGARHRIAAALEIEELPYDLDEGAAPSTDPRST